VSGEVETAPCSGSLRGLIREHAEVMVVLLESSSSR
jgi:hypothetical protein